VVATTISVSTRKQFFGMFLNLMKLEIVKREAQYRQETNSLKMKPLNPKSIHTI